MRLEISAPALDAIQRGAEQAPALVQRELLAMMTVVTIGLEGEVKDAMPKHSGVTANSIHSDAFASPAGVLGVVGSAQPAALFVELGTKPHMPPVEALVPWVRNVLGVEERKARSVAYLIARKIAREGTPARIPFRGTLERMAPQIGREFETAAGRIAQQLWGTA